MVRTACPLDCPDGCSLEVTVEGDRIVRIDAAPGNALTDGWICSKVRKHAERVHGPARLRTPLVRTGPKGSREFRAASWDEALDLVAAAVRRAVDEHGPASVIPYSYNSSAGVLANVLPDRLWRRVGAAIVEHTICAATASQAYADTFGGMLPADPLDVVHSRMVLVWGANPSASNTHFPPLVTQAAKHGAAVVVVDPRATPMAQRADHHLAVRPGTDVVLALAMAAHLEAQGLVDREFLAAHVDGAEEYLANARGWTLDRAADVCGVDAATIATVAELYATTRPAMLRIGWGLERNRNGGSACRSVLALPLLCGHAGVPGSGVLTSTTRAAGIASVADPDPHAPTSDDGRRRVNMNQLGALLCGELDGPPASVLVVQGANPAVMNPAQVDVLRGLAREDLFTVVHDQVLTDTAAFADVVLPATTHFEATDVATSYGSYALQRVVPVIPPVGESRTNAEVAAGLAERLGFPSVSFDPDPDRSIAAVVPGGELDGVRQLHAPGSTVPFRDVFPTLPSGRARLHLPESELPLPRFVPLDDASYPLTLITPASSRLVNSMFGEFNAPPAVVSLSPADAASRGLVDGARARVFNERGALEMTVRVDPNVRDGVCVIPKGLWRRDGWNGLTANALCPDGLSDLASGACFNDARVDVRPGA